MLLPHFDATSSPPLPGDPSAAGLGGADARSLSYGLLEPAMRDPTQQAYAECLAECKADGGTNCPTTCAQQTKPPVNYPSPSGPSPGVAACCAGKYSACIASAALGGGPAAVIGFAACSADYVSCLQSPTFPCNLP